MVYWSEHFILKGKSCNVRNHFIVSLMFVSECIHLEVTLHKAGESPELD